jgi:hypothetical protein
MTLKPGQTEIVAVTQEFAPTAASLTPESQAAGPTSAG